MIFDFILFSKLSSDSYPFLRKEQDGSRDFILGYIINNIDNSVLDFLYHPSFFKSGNFFCLALHSSLLKEGEEHNSVDVLIEYFGPIFFSLRYFKMHGNPVINVLVPLQEEDNDAVSRLFEPLKDMFNQLGYEAFYYCFINEKLEVLKTNIPYDLFVCNHELVNDEESPSKWYFHFLETSSGFQKLIVVFKAFVTPANIVFSEVRHVESKFKEDHPRIFALLEEGVKAKRELDQNEINLQGLRKELESKEAYIANLNIPESTMKKIVDFYYYEYEILPTWYKRVGHVIKVLMGRRTFRSLFDDKVKKYKD